MVTSDRVANPDVPEYRQQAILVAIKEARQYREKMDGLPYPPATSTLVAEPHDRPGPCREDPCERRDPYTDASAVSGKVSHAIWPV